MNRRPLFFACLAAAVGTMVAPSLPAQAVGDPLAEDLPRVWEMPPPEVVKGYLQLGFDRLSAYEFLLQAPSTELNAERWTGQEQIPDVVKSWNGKKAELKGFMLPIRMDKGLVTEFFLLRDQNTCCYGNAPSLNHFAIVKLAKGVKPSADRVVKVSGTFTVNSKLDAFGFLVSIYQLAGEKVEEVTE